MCPSFGGLCEVIELDALKVATPPLPVTVTFASAGRPKLANKLAFKALPPTLSLAAYFVLVLNASVQIIHLILLKRMAQELVVYGE